MLRNATSLWGNRALLKTIVNVPSFIRGHAISATNNLVNLSVNDKTGIATLTLNRPPVNSLNHALLFDISTALDDVAKNRSKGLILTSSSNTVFSAGLDILEMYKPVPENLRRFWTNLQDVWLKLYGSSFPTAVAINGHAPAGGCLLSLCCEYRVMCPNFTIGLNETKLGIVAPTWFMASMRNVLPPRQAEQALTLGTLFTTDEALKVGLIDEIAANKEEALDRCEKYLLKFSKIDSTARAITKKSFRGRDIAALEKRREEDVQLFCFAVDNPKVQKGLELYLESLKKKSK